MTRDMKLRGGVAILFFSLAFSACFKTLRMAPFSDAGDDADGTVGSTEGVDGTSFTIAITSPASPSYTNKAVEIDVSVTSGGTSETVQLLDNGLLLTTLNTAPYRFMWDTTKVAEGSHQLIAQEAVGGQIIASAPVVIIVDRTAPSIVSNSPGSGASNVSLTDAIQVVFSEALAPATVTAGSVSLSLGSAAVGSSATLGTDGKTIGVAIANRSSLALPGTMTEMVGVGITDLAGNAFAGASWSFTVPLWVDLGSVPGLTPQMALGPSDVPVVMTNPGTFQIARYLGGKNWDMNIPSPQTAGTMVTGGLAVDSAGEIYVAWTESSSSAVHVARWTGTTWDRSYGTVVSSATTTAEGASIALTSTGQPVVRWVEPVNMGRGPGYVSRWNGSSWTPYTDAPGDYLGPVVLDRSGFPITLAGYQMSRWTGSAWTSVQGTNVYGLAVSSTDDGIGLQLASDGTLQPLALSKAGVLSNFIPGLAGETVSDISLRIAMDNLDEPIITWYSYVGGTTGAFAQIHVARWTGATWDKGYGVLANATNIASLALAGGAVPIVAYGDFATPMTHVAKSNH